MTQDTIWDFLLLGARRRPPTSPVRMFPPRWSYLEKLWWPIWETLNIATIGTLLAVISRYPACLSRRAQHHAERDFVRPVALC